MDGGRLISDVEGLSGLISLDGESAKEIGRVSAVYPFRVPRFYGSLMERENPRSVPYGFKLSQRLPSWADRG